MSIVSRLRERVVDSLHRLEEASPKEIAKAARSMIPSGREAHGRAARAPEPSPSVVAHATKAASDAARNDAPASPSTSGSKRELGVFAGVGASAAMGGDAGVGGELSAGFTAGSNGTVQSYGTTGVVNGAIGVAAGAGVEVGIADVSKFYGEGYQLSGSVGAFTGSLSFTRDKEFVGGSLAVGKSVGGGLFHFETTTVDRSGR